MNDTLLFTPHVEKRIRQRGLREMDIGLIMEFGTPAGDGVLLEAKRAKEEAARLRKQASRLDKLANKFIVLRGGVVITAFKATKKQVKRWMRHSND